VVWYVPRGCAGHCRRQRLGADQPRSRWCVENGQDWLPVSPKRRATLANKGYVEAEAPYLVEVCGSRHGGRQWFEPLQPLGDPIVDAWGEPVPRPKPAAS
jgi:hypothetical protein